MRHIDRLPKPAILRDKQAEWQEKYEEKLVENPKARPDSSKYAHKDIRDTLYAMSYGKCFYCETKLSGGNKEVDHFIEVAIEQDDSLSLVNWSRGECRNDVQLKAVMDRYDLYSYLINENISEDER